MTLLKNFVNLLQKYQEGLEESMRGNGFNFNSVDLLYCHLQKNKSEQKEITALIFALMIIAFNIL